MIEIFAEFDYQVRDELKNSKLNISDLIITTLSESIQKMGDIKFSKCKFKNSKFENGEKLLLPLFNGNKELLDWFANYFEKKLPNWSNYAQENNCDDYVLQFYISHYLSILLFSLFVENDDENENKSRIVIPKFDKSDMKPFFELIEQYGIFNACFPKISSNEDDENFCLKQFIRCMFDSICFLVCLFGMNFKFILIP